MYPSPLGLIVFLIMAWLVWLMIDQAIEDHKRRKEKRDEDRKP